MPSEGFLAAAALCPHPYLASTHLSHAPPVHTSVPHPITEVNSAVLLLFGLRHLKSDY